MMDTAHSTQTRLRVLWRRRVDRRALVRAHAAFWIATGCLLVALVVRASETTDSGWSVASAPSVLGNNQPVDPRVRIAINHVLEQGRLPLLQAPAQQHPNHQLPTVEEQPIADEAAAAAAAEGWRPAQSPSDLPERESVNDEAAETVVVGPQFRSAVSTPESEFDELDEAAEIFVDQDVPVVEEPPAIVEAADAPTIEPPASVSTSNTTPVTSDSPQSSPARPQQSATDSGSPAAPPAVAPAPLPPLSQNMRNLRAKVRRVLKSYYNRPLNSHDNDPWEMMHGMLAYGVHSKVRQGGPRGKTITLVGWLCFNRPCKGMTLLYATPDGDLRAKHGVGLQGHMGQFLAMLAQSQVSPDYPVKVRNREYTVRDLIEAEKVTCYPKSELTFKLIALMHYLDSDATWVNDQGTSWDIPRLIREELAQPIRGAACGGTHRLAGLSLAARTRVRRGEPLDGEYLRAAQFVEKYHNYAYQMQNRDGSLSTQWFRGRGAEDDINRRVKTTGHILEWLIYSVDDKEVRSTRTFRAVNYLASLLANNFNNEWEVGPLSHALHALRLYDERVYQPYDGQTDLVKKSSSRKTARRPSTSRSSQKK